MHNLYGIIFYRQRCQLHSLFWLIFWMLELHVWMRLLKSRGWERLLSALMQDILTTHTHTRLLNLCFHMYILIVAENDALILNCLYYIYYYIKPYYETCLTSVNENFAFKVHTTVRDSVKFKTKLNICRMSHNVINNWISIIDALTCQLHLVCLAMFT